MNVVGMVDVPTAVGAGEVVRHSWLEATPVCESAVKYMTPSASNVMSEMLLRPVGIGKRPTSPTQAFVVGLNRYRWVMPVESVPPR